MSSDVTDLVLPIDSGCRVSTYSKRFSFRLQRLYTLQRLPLGRVRKCSDLQVQLITFQNQRCLLSLSGLSCISYSALDSVVITYATSRSTIGNKTSMLGFDTPLARQPCFDPASKLLCPGPKFVMGISLGWRTVSMMAA